jgi:hypothetical protein
METPLSDTAYDAGIFDEDSRGYDFAIALEQRLRIAEDALNEVLKDSRDPQIEDITFRRLQMSEVRGALAQIQAIKLP